MRISSKSPINHTQIFFNSKQIPPLKRFSQLKSDIFQKTSAVKNNCNLDTKSINQIYQETLERTLEINPIMKELGIQKPKLIIEEMDDTAASYDFPSNTISLNSKFKQDVFCHEAIDNFGNVIYAKITFNETPEFNFSDTEIITKELKTTKLNQDEKRLYLKSVLMHELRHWTQEHILASTKGCESLYERKLKAVKKLISAQEEMIEYCKKEKIKHKLKEYKAKLAATKKQYSYILTYKPKQVLDENYKLKCSMLPYEDKYWSMKEHFLPASNRYKSSNDNEYTRNPIEIDAFYCQSEFLLDEEINKPNPNIRSNVFAAMSLASAHYGLFAIENLKQYGYPPLIEINSF